MEHNLLLPLQDLAELRPHLEHLLPLALVLHLPQVLVLVEALVQRPQSLRQDSGGSEHRQLANLLLGSEPAQAHSGQLPLLLGCLELLDPEEPLHSVRQQLALPLGLEDLEHHKHQLHQHQLVSDLVDWEQEVPLELLSQQQHRSLETLQHRQRLLLLEGSALHPPLELEVSLVEPQEAHLSSPLPLLRHQEDFLEEEPQPRQHLARPRDLPGSLGLSQRPQEDSSDRRAPLALVLPPPLEQALLSHLLYLEELDLLVLLEPALLALECSEALLATLQHSLRWLPR